MNIIDAHSHIGNDFFNGVASMNEYIKLLKKTGVSAGLLMSVPSPIYTEKEEKKLYLRWEIKDGLIYHGYNNPYEKANSFVYESIKANNSDILTFYVMIIHPVLDTIEYIQKEIESKSPVALKIHGICSGVSPADMSDELTTLIKANNIPIIVHTDYENDKSKLPYNLRYIINVNNARDWAKYFHGNQIRGILNHGCSLDSMACNLVNSSPYLKVGLGPDFLFNHESDRLNVDKQEASKKGYLKLLREKLLLSKILFDIDFNWNKKPDSDELDLGFVERIKEEWTNQAEQEMIFAGNLVNHIPVLRKNI